MGLSAAGLRRRYYRCYAACWLPGLALAGLGAALLGAAVYHGVLDRRFAANGVRTVATVIRKQWQDHGTGTTGQSPDYLLTYEYRTAKGQVRQGTSDVPRSTWARLRVGDELPVEYLRGDPATSEAVEERGAFAPGAAAIVALLLAGGGLYLLARAIRGAEGRVRLVRDGAAALGWITEVKVTQIQRSRLDAFLFTPFGSRRIRTYHQPRYAFKDAGGREHAGEGLVSRTRCWQRGDPVLVTYDPDRPERHEMDWFGFRDEELHALLEGA